MAKIYVLHENDEWVVPLRKQLDARELPYEEWFLHEGVLDLSQPPPEGVFYNRMSASSHTRDHRFAPEYTAAILSWLEAHSRTVFNGSRALMLEVSKVAQYASLETFGIRTPKTLAAIGRHRVVEAAQSMEGSFITKHNRAGKGLGVHLFHDVEALQRFVEGPEFEPSIDGITLIQEYIEAPEPFITRMEFINGQFFYAVRVDTSDGFQLCPADVCAIDDQFCPTTARAKFEIIQDFSLPNIEAYEAFLAANDIRVAGIEFIVNKEGTVFTYDVNTNTNYNSDAEALAGVSAFGRLSDVLGDALQQAGGE
ncbi:MAG: alpha-L-glutamate ligase [Deltaproteobacteria bacterium]|nr:MAG: alpha-L-glutamate ligase [Deltaproteobacteria bacterium]